MRMIDDPVIDKAFRYFSKQLVALGVKYQSVKDGILVGEPSISVFTGFIYDYKKKWFWVSAGHVFEKLDELEEYARKGQCQIFFYRMLSGFEPEGNKIIPIPFIYNKTDHLLFSKFEEGLDFGFYELDLLTKENLRKDKVIPFITSKDSEKNVVDLNRFYLLGFPNSHIYHQETSTRLTPEVINLKLPPDGEEISLEKGLMRLVFFLPDDCDINITGMSGGPIIGFSNTSEDRYWLIGIQSSWKKERRQIFVCPTSEFMTKAQEYLSSKYN